MFGNSLAFIATYLWHKSIENINQVLNESESEKFTANDYYYLSIIACMNSPSSSEVASKLKLTKPAITLFVKKMQTMDLLLKVPSSSDKRKSALVLSEKAKHIVEGDSIIFDELIEILTGQMTEKQLTDFTFLLNSVEKILKKKENSLL